MNESITQMIEDSENQIGTAFDIGQQNIVVMTYYSQRAIVTLLQGLLREISDLRAELAGRGY